MVWSLPTQIIPGSGYVVVVRNPGSGVWRSMIRFPIAASRSRSFRYHHRACLPVPTMDFTQAYKQTNFLVEFSKGAQWILTAVGDRLIVRRADSFLIERTWLVESAPITHIGWSWDSEYVFGANSKQGAVNVFKITDETWNARIVAGAEGLARVEWAPDGRSIICFSEWGVGQCILLARPHGVQPSQLRVTIWSLTTGSATYIQFPIHPDKGESVPSSNSTSLTNCKVIAIVPMGSTLFWPSATNPRTRLACMMLQARIRW